MQRKKKEDNTEKSLEKQLLENLVQLQKVHTDLAEKFDHLSKQMSSLLALFEMAARSFAKNPANEFTEKDKDFLEKIDTLLEQNKTIAKGLTIMEERVRGRLYNKEEDYQAPQQKPLPKF